jgi:hypothetical protein
MKTANLVPWVVGGGVVGGIVRGPLGVALGVAAGWALSRLLDPEVPESLDRFAGFSWRPGAASTAFDQLPPPDAPIDAPIAGPIATLSPFEFPVVSVTR